MSVATKDEIWAKDRTVLFDRWERKKSCIVAFMVEQMQRTQWPRYWRSDFWYDVENINSICTEDRNGYIDKMPQFFWGIRECGTAFVIESNEWSWQSQFKCHKEWKGWWRFKLVQYKTKWDERTFGLEITQVWAPEDGNVLDR